MNPAKLLARLNGGVLGFRRLQSPVDGSRPDLTEQDVAHALALVISPEARLLGRVMYVGQERYLPVLLLHVELEIMEIALREGWDIDSKQRTAFANLALAEFIRPRICKTCYGQEDIPNPDNPAQRMTCPTCEGRGAKSWSSRARAKALLVTRYEWSKWEQRYKNEIAPILDRWHAILWAGIQRRLT